MLLMQRFHDWRTRRHPTPLKLSVLPPELLEQIFSELADAALLRVSGACRTFNDLCIRLYLIRRGNPRDVFLGKADLSLESSLLPPLRFSYPVPALERVCVRFTDADTLLSGLKDMAAVLPRLNTIQALCLLFPQDLFDLNDGAPPRTLMYAFTAVISAMAHKITGPAVVINKGDIFTCRASDISGWQLHRFAFNGGLRPPRAERGPWSRWRRRSSAPRPSFTESTAQIRRYTGEITSVLPIKSVSSVTILSLRDLPGPFPSATLITLDAEDTETLVLGDSGPHSLSHSIPAPELTSILPHMTFPALRRIELNTPDIAPSVLSDFFVRHPTVECVTYHRAVPSALHHARRILTMLLLLPALRAVGLGWAPERAYAVLGGPEDDPEAMHFLAEAKDRLPGVVVQLQGC